MEKLTAESIVEETVLLAHYPRGVEEIAEAVVRFTHHFEPDDDIRSDLLNEAWTLFTSDLMGEPSEFWTLEDLLHNQHHRISGRHGIITDPEIHVAKSLASASELHFTGEISSTLN